MVRSLVTGAALVLMLGACSDSGESPAPTGSASVPSASSSASPESPAPDLCPDQDTITDAGEIATFAVVGEATAAQDEAAEFHGQTWRRFLPLTVTNPLDFTCKINVVVSVTGSDDGYVDGGGTVVLGPGETAELQIFDLDSTFEFEGDTEDAAPAETLTPTVHQVSTGPVYDYYDAEFEFGEITGEGAEAVLPVTVTKNAIRDGVPEAAGLKSRDVLYIDGLDASGAAVARFMVTAEPAPEVGSSQTYEVPATIAGNYDNAGRAFQPLSATENIVEYRVSAFQPLLIEK
ncbi:hypothetical protein GCM10011331_05960 [Flavimobilis marinus]|nr:hypothetical protein GCM10011331_05960 [Flavimobilis marinus]